MILEVTLILVKLLSLSHHQGSIFSINTGLGAFPGQWGLGRVLRNPWGLTSYLAGALFLLSSQWSPWLPPHGRKGAETPGSPGWVGDSEQEGPSGPSLEIGALCPQPGQHCSLAASRDLYVATISLGIASRHFLGEGGGLGERDQT